MTSATISEVELFLASSRSIGSTREIQERRRLLDVLNEGNDYFRLDNPRVAIAGSAQPMEFDRLNFEKRLIVIAIPRENAEQLRSRSMFSAFGSRTQTVARNMTLLLPPFAVEGTLHIPQSYANLGENLHASPNIFGRFMPVTNATLFLPDGTRLEAPILLANRDLVAAMGATGHRAASDRTA